MSVGSNIRKLREKHHLTQDEFGKIADVSSMAVSQWENDRAVPRMGAETAVHEVLLHREKGFAFCRCGICVSVQVGETVHDVAQEFLRFGNIVLRGVAGGSLIAHNDLAVWKGDDVCGRRVIEKFGMHTCDGGIIHQRDLDMLQRGEHVLRPARGSQQIRQKLQQGVLAGGYPLLRRPGRRAMKKNAEARDHSGCAGWSCFCRALAWRKKPRNCSLHCSESTPPTTGHL